MLSIDTSIYLSIHPFIHLSIILSIHPFIHLFIHSLSMYTCTCTYIYPLTESQSSISFSSLNTNQISTDVYFPWFWNVTQTWDTRLSLLKIQDNFFILIHNIQPFCTSHFCRSSSGRLCLYLLQLILTHGLKMTDSLLEAALTMDVVHSTTTVSPMEYPAMNRVISGM